MEAFGLLWFELPQDDFNPWKSCQGVQIGLLIRPAGPDDHCREVPNGLNVVVGPQHREKPFQVQPFVRRVLDGPVVQIEPVDVDDRSLTNWCRHDLAGLPGTRKKMARRKNGPNRHVATEAGESY